MGDGETPSFAEAMALQKAKQMALEQAGTYVESYTKVQNYTLTADEIQTIAGGVLQVEVLEKKRELIGDGLRHYVKIKATVTTDKIADLAQRIKGKNVAEEYKKLQEDYARLGKEIESWKQLISKTPAGPERDLAVDQIRRRERAFTELQRSETTFLQLLVSGETLIAKAQDLQTNVDQLVETIANKGFHIAIGEATAIPLMQSDNLLTLILPISIRPSENLIPMLSDVAQTLDGTLMKEMSWVRLSTFEISLPSEPRGTVTLIRLAKEPRTALYFQKRIAMLNLFLEFHEIGKISNSCTLGRYRLQPIADWEKRGDGVVMLGESNPSYFDSGDGPGKGFVGVFLDELAGRVEIDLPQKTVKNMQKITARLLASDHRTTKELRAMPGVGAQLPKKYSCRFLTK